MEKTDLGDAQRVVLLDNGSLSPDAVLQARSIANALSDRTGMPVDAVSVLHSDRIDDKELGGAPGAVWESYLEEADRLGVRRLLVLPLFFGPSYGLRKAKALAASFEEAARDRRIDWAEPLAAGKAVGLVDLMTQDVIQLLDTVESGVPIVDSDKLPLVLLVDHGSPFQEVAECRNRIAGELKSRLKGRARSVIACSMERREGDRYAFNEPLLADALNSAAQEQPRSIILSRLFLFPGRHAGPGGDIDLICQASKWAQSGGTIQATPLLGTNAGLVDLLELRFQSIRDA